MRVLRDRVYKWKIAAAIVSPVMTVIRATPVASFIMVLWVLIQGNENAVPSAVAFLMVMPLLWESIVQGLGARDKNLSEVLDVFGAPPARRFLLLTLPTLTDHALPALVNAVGLAWKAGIAAEIIAYTKNSIGRQIKDAKDSLEAAEMFAWTLCVIAVSLLLEALIGAVAGRYRKTIAKKEEKGRERDPGTDEAIR